MFIFSLLGLPQQNSTSLSNNAAIQHLILIGPKPSCVLCYIASLRMLPGTRGEENFFSSLRSSKYSTFGKAKIKLRNLFLSLCKWEFALFIAFQSKIFLGHPVLNCLVEPDSPRGENPRRRGEGRRRIGCFTANSSPKWKQKLEGHLLEEKLQKDYFKWLKKQRKR